MEGKAHQVTGAAKDHRGLEATQGPQASDRKGIKVCLPMGVVDHHCVNPTSGLFVISCVWFVYVLKGNLDLLDLLGPLDQKVRSVRINFKFS